MELKSLYREILNEHNINPSHKAEMENPSVTLQGVNPSCGDNITLFLKTENGKITRGSFTGSGCAVSQASVDMMLDLIIGQDEKEALRLAENFMAMIKGEASPEQIEELDEAGALQDISHMPARVKCAVLGWRTMSEMLQKGESSAQGSSPHCETK
ncbi:MAG: SUF system NifU family Fe-S cluster assembly protein [Treponema sp.]|nr:SUF system NifU family Fe-S cluster assembly protein [Treponema sp.]MBR4464063.1 SUF system NifU family Fe-S cluster assembly protein [Treponema sp.]